MRERERKRETARQRDRDRQTGGWIKTDRLMNREIYRKYQRDKEI